MLFWFTCGAIFGVWNVFQSSGLDFRLIALGSLLPLVLDAPFGVQAYAHTLLSAVIVLIVGVAQAAALAAGPASSPVTRVLSSPLQRARATAAAIANVHGIEVECDERLIELDYGKWDTLPLRDIPADAWTTWRSDSDFAPPGGERLTDVSARVESFIADLATDDLVVAVSHVSPIKAAVWIALDV